jgi:hypothetical protein
MADLTFQSQQMGAELTQRAGSEVSAAAGNLGQGIAAGADAAVKRGIYEGERADTKEQNQQQNQLDNKRLGLEARKVGAYEGEIALNQERFSMEKIREQRAAAIDAVRLESEKIELEKRMFEHKAMQAVTDDQRAEAEVAMMQLQVAEQKARTEQALRAAAGKPSPESMIQWLDNPEAQLLAGHRVTVDGKAVPLSDSDRKQLEGTVGRAGALKTLDTLIKSTAEYNPALAGKLTVVGMGLSTGRMKMEDAEKAIDKALAEFNVQHNEDGTISAKQPAAQAAEPMASLTVAGYKTPVRYIGEANARKVTGWSMANVDKIRKLMEEGKEPGRRIRSDDEIIQDWLNVIGNPKDEYHGVAMTILMRNGVINQQQAAPNYDRSTQVDAWGESLKKQQTQGIGGQGTVR